MTLTPGLRRFTFTTHVTSSCGWVGAVIVFLALAVIGLTSDDEATVRGAYLVMAPAAWFVLVPLAHASFLSGMVLSLGTAWGLFRHYWVVLKLLITAFATVILLIYMETFRGMADVAADPVAALGLVRNPSPVVHAILALILLLLATALAVYKPFGMTPYGRRKHAEQGGAWALYVPAAAAPHRGLAMSTPRWRYTAGVVAAIIVLLLFALLHFTGTGVQH